VEKNKDKEKVKEKLIIQKKKRRHNNNKNSVCLAKALDLFLWHPILVLVLGILGFVGKGTATGKN
jgi:hypothetical protein